MSVNITAPLVSKPQSIAAGQTAQLRLELITTTSPFEAAQITYRVNPPVVFAHGTSVLETTEFVFPTGTTSITPYSLKGGVGGVRIAVEVTPATPPARSGTMVVLKPAALIRAGVRAGGRPARPATGRKRVTKAARAARTRKSAARSRKVVKRAARTPRKRATSSSRSRRRR